MSTTKDHRDALQSLNTLLSIAIAGVALYGVIAHSTWLGRWALVYVIASQVVAILGRTFATVPVGTNRSTDVGK